MAGLHVKRVKELVDGPGEPAGTEGSVVACAPLSKERVICRRRPARHCVQAPSLLFELGALHAHECA